MKLFLVYHKKRKTVISISAITNMNGAEMPIFFIKLILLSKEYVYCYTFRVILTLHEYLHIYYKLSLAKY